MIKIYKPYTYITLIFDKQFNTLVLFSFREGTKLIGLQAEMKLDSTKLLLLLMVNAKP